MSEGKREWHWGDDGFGHEGVRFEKGRLLWFTQKNNPRHGGGACSQSYESFRRDGPKVSDVPDSVLNAVKAEIAKRT